MIKQIPRSDAWQAIATATTSDPDSRRLAVCAMFQQQLVLAASKKGLDMTGRKYLLY